MKHRGPTKNEMNRMNRIFPYRMPKHRRKMSDLEVRRANNEWRAYMEWCRHTGHLPDSTRSALAFEQAGLLPSR